MRECRPRATAGRKPSRGELLLFIDADVVLAPGGMCRVFATMARPEVGALIGSYDAYPDDASIVSRFKNLAHHYFHQHSHLERDHLLGCMRRGPAEVLFRGWRIRRERFKLPSIEDVELGYRLVDRGVLIVLDPELQVKHLKRWTLDVADRN